MIKNITIAENALVTLLPGVKHPFEDGEHIIFSEIEGMNNILGQIKQLMPTEKQNL